MASWHGSLGPGGRHGGEHELAKDGKFVPIEVKREIFGSGENLLVQGDIRSLPKEISRLAGQIQCVYLDPPFMTGEKFARTRPWGAKGWQRGSPQIRLPAYEDSAADEKAYLRLLSRMIRTSRRLLSDTGVLCLHLDWRMSARARILCDQIFGRDLFLNEVIWAYESGGRSKRTFSRKHETILLYAKTPAYRFDISRVPLERKSVRKNHMARGMDEDGRMYSKIVTGGKEYRYYDDEPVYPGDVWNDISHLQQRDPERTGYPTQKPVKLLERLLLPVTREGDWAADLCCGSGTALAAAQGLGLRFAGMDLSPEAVAVSLARLRPENLTVICPGGDAGRLLVREADGRFELLGLESANSAFPAGAAPLDAVEAWETGRVEKGVFIAERRYQRSFRYPELVSSLKVEPGQIQAVLVTDAAGRRTCYQRTGE